MALSPSHSALESTTVSVVQPLWADKSLDRNYVYVTTASSTLTAEGHM